MTELHQVAAVLADWSSSTSVTIYLFGSRVRGDHTPDSDVDVLIRFSRDTTEADLRWWGEQNQDSFATINLQLPGRLKILEYKDRLARKVIDAGKNPVHRDRNVICVWLPPTELKRQKQQRDRSINP